LATGPLVFFASEYLFPFAKKFNFPHTKRFIAERIPLQRAREFLHVIDVMQQTSIDIVEEKKKALMSSDPTVVADIQDKKDIISILSAYYLNFHHFDCLSFYMRQ
jgi:hypothetical protein